MNNQRSELSAKNKYWISKYRYLELKNFCFQYPEWKKNINEMSYLKAHTKTLETNAISDPTNDIVLVRLKLKDLIDLIETTAYDADPFIAKWLIKGITENISYEYLRYKLDLPAGREMYYDRYRRFFWLLDQRR